MKILIDNGHGENTAGKHSPDGRLRECLCKRNRQAFRKCIENKRI